MAACQNCRYWQGVRGRDHYAACIRIVTRPERTRDGAALAAMEGPSVLITNRKFGCRLYEAREAPKPVQRARIRVQPKQT